MAKHAAQPIQKPKKQKSRRNIKSSHGVLGLLLFLILQIFRGNLTFGEPVLERYFWYGYYIPYIVTPLMLFLCALAAYRAPERPLPRWSWLVTAATAASRWCSGT